MPLGDFEAGVLKTISLNRSPDSHVAGATVLNQDEGTPRFSRDIDLFHDTEDALIQAFATDRETLIQAGFAVEVSRDLETFKRALVSKGPRQTKVEWVRDAAFRFFPVEPDPMMGYRLNRWDAATNKVLAATSRIAIRDYIDLLHLHNQSLSLGALTWAAAGKDGGLSPDFILEELQRLQKYPPAAYANVDLKDPPDPVALKQIWLTALREARELFDLLLELDAPYGCFFLDPNGVPQTPDRTSLASLRPHFGTLRGCWPQIAS